MISVRASRERGHFDHGWLDTYHSFSFGEYYDPAHTSFRSLRVINEDWIREGAGFGLHPHQDMEILTWVLSGALEHKDSLGNGGIIAPGEAQRMSAGTGITHSEFNASDIERVHLLQIWILPERKGIAPSYEQKHFPLEERRNHLRLIASRDGRKGSITLHQDVDVRAGLLDAGSTLDHELALGRHAWIQVARGHVTVNDVEMRAGDGAALSEERILKIQALDDSEVLLFDLG